MSSDGLLLLTMAMSAFGFGWIFGKGIKVYRQFLDQIF